MVYYSVVLVLLFEVIVTIMVGFGVYFGFTVFPYSPADALSTGVPGQFEITATLPIAMPGISDLNIPYTYLDDSGLEWGAATIIVSVVMVVVQSFVRGMYLGGLQHSAQSGSIRILVGYGRKFFGRMLIWSVFQFLYAIIALLLALVFFPLGIILFIIILFFSLTPYLVVLQDIPFGEALAKAPRIFFNCFIILLPLALATLLSTLFISLLKQLPPPFGYAVPLLAYAIVGTALIYDLIRILARRLPQIGEQVGPVLSEKPAIHRARSLLYIVLLTACGTFAASGHHLGVSPWGVKKELTGIAYHASFSVVFYRSDQSYNSYVWDIDDQYRMDIQLPDLSVEDKPDHIRGVAEVTWQMEEKVRYRHGNSTHNVRKPFIRQSRLLYNLARETAEDGSIYYSSERGSVSILLGGKQPYKPLSAEMMVSGDGSDVFVLQSPVEFDASPVFRVTDNGQYLATGTSRINPMEFRTYWFRENQESDEVFKLLAAKNSLEYVSVNDANGIIASLAVALQEADGSMLVEILDILERLDVPLVAPIWEAEDWTDYLRSLYADASLEETLDLLTNAGIQHGFKVSELFGRRDEQMSVYQLTVPFPKDTLIIEYEQSNEDYNLLSVTISVGESSVE